TYANGFSAQYEYDNLDRVEKICQAQNVYSADPDESLYVPTYEMIYNGEGDLYELRNYRTNRASFFDYDHAGRCMASKERAFTVTDGVLSYGAELSSYGYRYDECNNLTKLTCSVLGSRWSTVYTYDNDNRASTTTLSSGKVLSNTFDALGRLQKRTLKQGNTTIHETALTYVPGDATNKTTGLVAAYQNGSDAAYGYTYDAVGNITAITQGTTSITYEYDVANRLTRENNSILNQTITYEYDYYGNIQSKKTYAYSTGDLTNATYTEIEYEYETDGWSDQLVSFNDQAIAYDEMGNPTTYRGYTFGWRGKQLTSASDGTNSLTFEYNEDGLRQKKTVNNVDTDYFYNGSVLIGMQRGTSKFLFSYDASGNVVSVNYNGTEYYYLRNAQGDIVKIIDASGNPVVEYTYDTWGKKVTTTGSLAGTLGLFQPFRYRGYVYDEETGLYYLQSRYYDPTTGRFISADVLLSTGQGVLGHNCYAYCLGNPVGMVDDGGSAARDLALVSAEGPGSYVYYPKSEQKILSFEEGEEQKAIDALIKGNCTVYYRGALLVAFSEPERGSFAVCGTIFVNTYYKFEPTDLKHEYGHIIQERRLGTIAYIKRVAIPSVIGFYASKVSVWVKNNYYNLPVERSADFNAGISNGERSHSWWSIPLAIIFEQLLIVMNIEL
ncbi:MAG: RHS repeat-associated core domain-containing protein, partial [Clostridia bacterium]|nr:RHS repeat-associated core domain-containing protein [Clostridia bacterium]